MGYDAVSVAPNFVPEIKYAIRKVSHAQAVELAAAAARARDTSEVRAVVARCRDLIS
ncbi:hypothetical protein D3C83_290650 [compost metagenome]